MYHSGINALGGSVKYIYWYIGYNLYYKMFSGGFKNKIISFILVMVKLFSLFKNIYVTACKLKGLWVDNYDGKSSLFFVLGTHNWILLIKTLMVTLLFLIIVLLNPKLVLVNLKFLLFMLVEISQRVPFNSTEIVPNIFLLSYQHNFCIVSHKWDPIIFVLVENYACIM